ncbi:hypothetical protein ACHAW6_005487 [Cyclotella cf. meneghiniana]
MIAKVNGKLDEKSQSMHPNLPHHSSLSSDAMFDQPTKGNMVKLDQSHNDNASVNSFAESICGAPSRKLNQFHANDSSDVHSIVGGIEATVGRYLYVVGLTYSSSFSSFNCGGSLIAPDAVLTAAHCIDPEYNFFIAINGHNTTDWEGEVIPMTEAFIHPNYNDFTEANDFAVVILDVATTQDVQFIKLNHDESYPPVKIWVMGWGDTTEGGSWKWTCL